MTEYIDTWFVVMRAEVTDFEWPDLERDAASVLQKFAPRHLFFVARPLGGQGGETFQLTVCTPEGLTDLLARDGAVIGRHFLFVQVVEVNRVESVIRDRLRRLDGESWIALAQRIGRIGY